MNTTGTKLYQSRAVVMDDLQAVVDLINANEQAKYGTNEITCEELRSQWEAPIFHLAEDALAWFSEDQQLVAYAEFWDQRAHHVRLHAYAVVHPQHCGQGLGSQAEAWLRARALKNVSLAPDGARVVLHQFLNTIEHEACQLLSNQGWQAIRSNYRMMIDLPEVFDEPQIPEGIVIRSVENEDDLRAGMFAAYDSFLDHWGAVEEPFEEYYQRWKYMIEHDPHHDPSLWFLALEGDTVVASCRCSGHMEEDPQLGWVGTLGVRRAWRKRGVGNALLQRSFYEFARRGYQRVGLGVDASSLTGATRLYENAGMRVVREYNLFEYELRPGQDLMRQALANE